MTGRKMAALIKDMGWTEQAMQQAGELLEAWARDQSAILCEALREIISESAPVAWVGRDDIESAKAWEIKVTALLRAEGGTK